MRVTRAHAYIRAPRVRKTRFCLLSSEPVTGPALQIFTGDAGQWPRLPMKELVVAEKDIAAKKIAQHLSGGDADASKVGGINVYEWSEGKGKAKTTWTVIGLRGHIVSLDYPKEHQRWSLAKLEELVWAEPTKKVDSDAKAIGDAVKKLGKGADKLILATDYDREGELIG